MTTPAALTAQALSARAAELDAADPLAAHTAAFVRDGDVVSYLDGNSLGRPLAALEERFARFVSHDWGSRLIRGWDEGWMRRPYELGDRIGVAALGPAQDFTIVGIAKYGDLSSLGGATFAIFDVPTAQTLLDKEGKLDAVTAAHPGADARFLGDLDATVDWLLDVLRPGDLCLTLNAGDLTTVPDRVIAALEARG